MTAAAALGWISGGLLLAAPLLPLAWSEPPEAVASAGPWLLAGAGLCFAAGLAVASPRGRRRALLAAAACVVALLFAEVVLRLTIGPYHAPMFRVHGPWLYDYIPGTRRMNTKRDGERRERIAFDVNAEGFRGPEMIAESPGPGKRVIVYGDSMIAAESTPWDETFVARLGAELASATGGPVEAINAGVSGYGPDQACLRMEVELPALRPDLVVVVVTAENDYGDVVRNRLFDVEPGGDLRRNEPDLGADHRAAIQGASAQWMLWKTYAGAMAALHGALHDAGDPFPNEPQTVLEFCRMEIEIAKTRPDAVMNPYWDHVDEDVRLEPQSESARAKVHLMKRVLARIRDTAAAHRVPVLLVFVPSATDAVPGYGRGSVNAKSFPQYRPENLTAALRSAADLLGVPHVDLYPPFRDADPASLYFLAPDTHWNSAGQALAAKLAAREATARGLLR